jgi:hypothetical protein
MSNVTASANEPATSDTPLPDKVTLTTPRLDTFVEVPATLTDGVLLYRPDDNSFIALYPEEWLSCRLEAHENQTAIDELQHANRDVTEKSLQLHDLLRQPNPPKADIAAARQALDSALNTLAQKSEAAKKRVEAITDQKVDQNKLVEIVPLTMKRVSGKVLKTPIYLKADALKSALADKRVYLVEGKAERKKAPEGKLFDGVTLNAQEVRNRIANKAQDKAKFAKKWKWAPKDAEQFSGILTDWAKTMGSDATHFLERQQEQIAEGIFSADKRDPNNPYHTIDLKPEAQFMRWAAGAGAEANFMPFQGNLFDKRDKDWSTRFKRAAKSAQFNLKANAEASFAIGEAKVETILYVPHAAGWHLNAEVSGQPVDFGYFRLRAELMLQALAGASIALEAGAAIMIIGEKQGLKGTPKDQPGSKAKVSAKAEIKVFAGLKEGIELAGALQWLNPEGLVDTHAPKKVNPYKAIAAYTDVASLKVGASAIQGMAASLGFECDYRQGNFIVAANAGLCVGLGGSGQIAGKVSAAQIGHFFMCIAHQLKQADYKKLNKLMKKDVFEIFNYIMFLVVARDRKIESFINTKAEQIIEDYDLAVQYILQNGNKFIREIEERIKSGWGWYAYMPPEARGATIASICKVIQQPENIASADLKLSGAVIINELLATTQSLRHLDNTLDRITMSMTDIPGRVAGKREIELVIAETPFADCISQTEIKVANAGALLGRPFMRNDEPEFIVAQFPLQHPGYNVG